MLKNMLSVEGVQPLNKIEQKSIKGGRKLMSISDNLEDEVDCYEHYHFCDGAHPSDYEAFAQCMESCGC